MRQSNKPKWKSYLVVFCFTTSIMALFLLLCIFRSLRIKLLFLCVAIIYCIFILLKKKQSIFSRRTKSELVLALAIDSVCFFDFYFNAVHIRPGIVLLNKLPFVNLIDENCVYALIGIIISLIGFFGATTIAPYLLFCFKELYKIVKAYKIQFVSLLIVNVISFISIIRANYYYTDDLGRAVYGYELTGDFSRYIANILSELLHGNSWLADISPLPQLIALIIISLAGIVLLYIISYLLNTKNNKWSFIAVVPIGLSPYFLSCLSYKYDAPYMALSVFASIIPLVFYKYNIKIYSASVFFGIIVMCTTYQVSSGVFPMTVLLIALIMWIQKKRYKIIGYFLLSSTISYILALLVFRFFIMEPIAEDNYVNTGVSVTQMLPNIIEYLKLFNSDFPTIWKILIGIILLSFIIMIIRHTKQNKALTGLLSILVCISAFSLSFGVYIFFTNPLFDPRAFYGVGIFLSMLCCCLILNYGFYIGKLSVVAISCIFIIYSYIYGNALNIQKNYIDFRTEQIINDCNNLGVFNENGKTKFQAIGTAGYQRAVKNMIREYPILERQIKILLSDSTEWAWGTYQLKEYYGLDLELVDVSKLQLHNDRILKDTYYYTIYKSNDIIVLSLKDVENQIQ